MVYDCGVNEMKGEDEILVRLMGWMRGVHCMWVFCLL
jgi:hypothetical protein